VKGNVNDKGGSLPTVGYLVDKMSINRNKKHGTVHFNLDELIQFVRAKCVLCLNMLQTGCQANTLGKVNSFISFRGCV
jgi:hypothetical protein